jgi:hypothetical protein
MIYVYDHRIKKEMNIVITNYWGPPVFTIVMPNPITLTVINLIRDNMFHHNSIQFKES